MTAGSQGVWSGPVALDWGIPPVPAHPAHGLLFGDAALPVPNGFSRGDVYMLEMSQGGGVVVEPGRTHLAIYVGANSADATTWTAAEIEAAEGLSAGTVTESWLVNLTSVYGRSTDYALAPELAEPVWTKMRGVFSDTSYWMLLERGGVYSGNFQMGHGESALHPALLGAWGTGLEPRLESRSNTNSGKWNFVAQGIEFSPNDGFDNSVRSGFDG